jgi:hypothetical protein
MGIEEEKEKEEGRRKKLIQKKAPQCGASMNMAATYSPGNTSSTIGHEGLNYSVRNGKR